jgi:hypothetical protein
MEQGGISAPKRRTVPLAFLCGAAALSWLFATVALSADDDECANQCYKTKSSCLAELGNYTNCPGTGLFGDPNFAAHQECVRRVQEGRRQCSSENQECLDNCNKSGSTRDINRNSPVKVAVAHKPASRSGQARRNALNHRPSAAVPDTL